MLRKITDFLSNGGYATWFQSLIVVVSVVVAVYAIKESDTNVAVSNTVELAQKYFTDKPTLASASLRLRIAQYQAVQEAKKKIADYDQTADANLDRLFKAARPLVVKQISETKSLLDDYRSVDDFFSGVLVCVKNSVCDQTISVKLLGWEMLGFYNAACSYMEWSGREYKYDEDSPRYVAYLVDFAGYKDANKQYFCRDQLVRHLLGTD